MCKPGPSKEGVFGRVLSFKDYYEHKTKTDQGWHLSSKKLRNNKGSKVKAVNPEKESSLKPRRGKRLALKVPRNAPHKMLCEKAVEKWKAYHSNLYVEDEEYVLLLDNCKEAIFLPGPTKWVKILRE